MTQPGPSGTPEYSGAFPTRRELRAQREAAVRPSAAVTPAAVRVPAGASAPIAALVQGPVSIHRRVAKPVARVEASKPKALSARKSRQKRPMTVAVALLGIPGLLLTAALPAYAFTPVDDQVSSSASASRSFTTGGAQGVTVAAAGAHVTVARDGFTATSEEELAERKLEAERQAAAAAAAERAAEAAEIAQASAGEYAVRGERAEGDDYPWPYQLTDSQGGGISPLGYYYRECVDFVAWRLNRDAGATGGPWRWTWSNLTPGGGDASAWANAWASHGWATSNTPVVGAVAWFNYNHVAYVQSVSDDGSVVLEEYNWMSSHAYHTRTVSADEVPLFLYPPA